MRVLTGISLNRKTSYPVHHPYCKINRIASILAIASNPKAILFQTLTHSSHEVSHSRLPNLKPHHTHPKLSDIPKKPDNTVHRYHNTRIQSNSVQTWSPYKSDCLNRTGRLYLLAQWAWGLAAAMWSWAWESRLGSESALAW